MARASDGATRPAIGKPARATAADRAAARQAKAGQVRRAPQMPQVVAGAMQFLREVIAELNRVTWPDRQALIASSLVVVFVLTVTALYLAGCDAIFAWMFQPYIH